MSAFTYRYAFMAVLCGLLLSGTCMLRAQQSEQAHPSDGSSGSPHPGPPRGPQSPERELAHLTRVLTLTDAQKAPVLAVLEERHTKMDALMQSGSDHATIGQQMHAIMTTTNAEIRALLTESQQTVFDAMRPPHPPARGGEDDGPPPDESKVPPQ